MIGRPPAALFVVVIVAAATLTACAHRLGGTSGVWELRGAIVAVSEDRLSIRHKTGQIVELTLDDRTVVLRGDEHQGRDALRRERRVRVEVEPLATGVSRARIVRVYGGG